MTSHVDSDVLAVLCDVMQDEYPLLLDTYLSDSQERLLSLKQALEAGDSTGLRLAAHSFKGSCSNMGARALSDLCQQLEQAARAEQLALARVLVEHIQHEFAGVSLQLKVERQRF